MATGALDANGIWLYGEDDSEPTASALLNKLGNSVSDKFDGGLPVANGGTGATTVAAAQTNLQVGLATINPPTVVATGGTATESGLNQISFTTCTDIRLQNIFSSSFKHYRIIMYITAASATCDLAIRFMDGTTPVTGTAYNRHGFVAQSSTSSIAYTGQENATEAKFADAISSSDLRDVAVMDIVSPSTPNVPTFVTVTARGREAGGGFRNYTQIIEYNKTVAQSGILFKTSTGNFSGDIEVYGYNN